MLASQVLPDQISLEIIIMDCWNIWMQRNGLIFNGTRSSLNSWRHLLKKDLTLVIYRIKTRHVAGLKEWIDVTLPSFSSLLFPSTMLEKTGVG